MSSTTTASTGRYYPERFTLRVPAGLPQAIEVAARGQLTSPSEYVRRAVLRALTADGVHIGTGGNIETAS
jgi:hypothetical protein